MRKLLLSIAFAIVWPVALHAAVFNATDLVDAVDAAPGDGQCSTSTGTCSLRAAFMEANALPGRDTIRIGAGTHLLVLASSGPQGASLQLTEAADVQGAGMGASIIDANHLGPGVYVENYHPDRGFTISDLTIRGATGQYGALTVWVADGATIANVELTSNSSAYGIHVNYSGRIRIESSIVHENAGAGVGAFANERIEIVDTTTSSNGGQGIRWIYYPNPGSLLVRNVDVETNSLEGIRLEGYGIFRVELSSIVSNSGTGILVGWPAFASISRSEIAMNQGGGLYAMFDEGSRLTLSDSSVVANTNDDGAGGVEFDYYGVIGSAPTVIANSTISGNEGSTAGGVLVSAQCSDVLLSHSTVAGNVSHAAGGGLATRGAYSCSAGLHTKIQGVIVAGNSAATSSADCEVVGDLPGLVSLGGNMIGDGSGCVFMPLASDQVGTSTTPIDPLLAPLASSGGSTPVHLLLAGSPAIDSTSCGLPSDQRGLPRPLDGDDESGALCDSGSVEIGNATGDYDSDSVADSGDNCPTQSNATQNDVDADGVGDACDNCVTTANPRLGTLEVVESPWATFTGAQRDDDYDGYGNRCDAKFPGVAGTLVNSNDTVQIRASIGKSRTGDTCGTTGTRPCAIFDLDESLGMLGAGDTARFRQLLGKTVGPKCASCPLPCVAGPDGSCGP